MKTFSLTFPIYDLREAQDKLVDRIAALKDVPTRVKDAREELIKLRQKISSEVYHKANYQTGVVTIELNETDMLALKGFVDETDGERLSSVRDILCTAKERGR